MNYIMKFNVLRNGYIATLLVWQTTSICNQPPMPAQPPILSEWDGRWVPAEACWCCAAEE